MSISLPAYESIKLSIDKGTEEDYHLLRLYYSWYTGWFYRHRLKMVVDMIGKASYDRLLEVGVGSGIFLKELLRHANFVTGIDIHSTYLGVRRMLENEGVDLGRVDLRQGDIHKIPYPDDSFNAVVCISVLEHFTNPKPALTELRRVSKPHCPIILGFPAETRITKLLFALLGYDVKKIHHASHDTIIVAIKDVLFMDKLKEFPMARFPLYFACRAYSEKQ